MTFSFIDNEYYFARGQVYGEYDDAERFAYFSKAVLEVLPDLDWKPDVINCNDWQTALVPVYYNLMFSSRPFYENIKTVFTIHNIQYQGRYGPRDPGICAGHRRPRISARALWPWTATST